MSLGTATGVCDDVDDARVGGGSELCRGVGHHLDAQDGDGFHLLEVVLLAFLVEIRRTVVDEQLHFAHAAQTDVAFGVDLHAGHILQGIRDRSLSGFRVVDDVVDDGFSFVDEDRTS